MPPRSIQSCFVAEILGTYLLVLLGCGAVHSAVATGSLEGLWQVGIVWGVAIMLAVYCVGPVSGAHINPAITLGFCAWGLFPSNRVPAYVCGQLIGAMLAATTLFLIFDPFLTAKEQQQGVVRGQPGSEITAMCYGEYFPNPGLLAGVDGRYDAAEHAELNKRFGPGRAFLVELLGTAVLGFVVISLTDEQNPFAPGKLAPIMIGLTVATLICVIAPLTQACLNPARDFGPRLVAALAGWGRIALPGPRGLSFITVYILAPLLGGWTGMGVYLKLVRPALAALESKS